MLKVYETKTQLIGAIRKICTGIVRETFEIVESDEDLAIKSDDGIMYFTHNSEFIRHNGEWILDTRRIKELTQLWMDDD